MLASDVNNDVKWTHKGSMPKIDGVSRATNKCFSYPRDVRAKYSSAILN